MVGTQSRQLPATMNRLIAFVVLCGMCICVLSDAEGGNCIFDFEFFEAEPNSEDTIIDFSGEHISTLTEGDKTYHYITGESKSRSQVDNSIQAFYCIRKRGYGVVDSGILSACDFSANIFRQYLRPICARHTDSPHNTTLCDRDPSTIVHFWPVDSSDYLVAPSKLDQGNYRLRVIFMKDEKVVGGMKGDFNVIPV